MFAKNVDVLPTRVSKASLVSIVACGAVGNNGAVFKTCEEKTDVWDL